MSNIDPLPKPPIPTSASKIDPFVWNKWFNYVYQQYFNDASPNAVLTTSQAIALGFVFPCDATSGNITLTLPAANQAKQKKYLIKKIDSSAHTVIVAAVGSDKIDGTSTKVLTNQFDSCLIESDGNQTWYVLLNSSGSSGSGAPINAEYVVMALDPTLTQERVLTAGTNITIVDGGANGPVTINATSTPQFPIYVYTP